MDGLAYCWLPSLHIVSLSQNSVSSIQTLHGVISLTNLTLTHNQLIGMSSLTNLTLTHNQLIGMSSLTNLTLTHNQLIGMSSLITHHTNNTILCADNKYLILSHTFTFSRRFIDILLLSLVYWNRLVVWHRMIITTFCFLIFLLQIHITLRKA